MADFPRDLLPEMVGMPKSTPATVTRPVSGKLQVRASPSAGATWSELWSADSRSSYAMHRLIALADYYFTTGESFTLRHLSVPGSGMDKLGEETRTPTVDGGSQTGGSLRIAGLTPSLIGAIRAGDAFQFSGDTVVRRAIADVNANGAGGGILRFYPVILSGGSPASGSPINLNAIKYNCIVEEWTVPQTEPARALQTLKITFLEST